MKPSLVIVGLGNPGAQYERTRHNAGFVAMDRLANEFGTGDWKEQPKFRAFTCEARMVTVPILLVKPLTYMNLSGEAIRKIIDFYKLDPRTQLIVCSDEIDIPLGTLRFRLSGSAGTHNGLKSVLEQFGEEFPRLRIGIGPRPQGVDLAAWVLSAMSDDERKALDASLSELPELIRTFVMEKQTEEE